MHLWSRAVYENMEMGSQAGGCSVERRCDLRLGFIPDESESSSRWISRSTLNTQKNMVHTGPHLGNKKEFESRLILWTVIFPRWHLHVPGITGLWGDYQQGRRVTSPKKFFHHQPGHKTTHGARHNKSICGPIIRHIFILNIKQNYWLSSCSFTYPIIYQYVTGIC